jgi:hypothetical protein
MILLAVQQGIASLPPTAGQSFVYEYDRKVDSYNRSDLLGPTSLRSTETIGAGALSLRVATSYFEAADTLGPIAYKVSGANPRFADPPGFCTKFGLQAGSRVGLISFATTYGFTDRIDGNFSLPLVVSDTTGSEIFTQANGTRNPNQVDGALCAQLDAFLAAGGLRLVKRPFADIRLAGGTGVDFNGGTNFGVGRMSVGAKGVLYAGRRLELAFAPEFFFPSPNEHEFAGSASAALLPRVVTQVKVADPLRLYLDAGYDYDFENDELRRFTWTVGASTRLPIVQGTVDVGFGGSKFNRGIEWTPGRATFVDDTGRPAQLTALADNQLGRNFVDFLGGIKLRLAENSVLAGAVSVPLNGEGFRATAVGTLALEQYF